MSYVEEENTLQGLTDEQIADLKAKFEMLSNNKRMPWRRADRANNTDEKPLRYKHIHRNDPCTCGSGKKSKKCCGVVTEYGFYN